MSDLFAYAFTPAGIAWLLAVGALWLCLRPRSRLVPRLLLTIALIYLTFSLFVVSFQFERLLVWGYRPLGPADVPPGRRVIVVLGSGSLTARNWDGGALTTVDLGAAERVLEAARVYRMVGAEAVIGSGGSVRRDGPDEPTGVAMRNALRRPWHSGVMHPRRNRFAEHPRRSADHPLDAENDRRGADDPS